MSLIVVGICIILGVLTYNTWQRFKAKSRLPHISKNRRSEYDENGLANRNNDTFYIDTHLPFQDENKTIFKGDDFFDVNERREPGFVDEAIKNDLLNTQSTLHHPVEKQASDHLSAAHFSQKEKTLLTEFDQTHLNSAQLNVSTKKVYVDTNADVTADVNANQNTVKTIEKFLDDADKSDADKDLSLIDDRIDCIIALKLPNALNGEQLMTQTVNLRHAGTKLIMIEGHIAYDQRHSKNSHQPGELDNGQKQFYEPLQRKQTYDRLLMAVQIANRTGALNEIEFSEFVAGVERLADSLEILPEIPDMTKVVSMGRELDAFAASCDVQLSLNILCNESVWSGSFVQKIATQDGLKLSRDGTRFVKLDRNNLPIFSLRFQNTNFLRDDLLYASSDLITLILDVPTTDEDVLPFRLVCDYAHSLSQRIGGYLVDDQRRQLTSKHLSQIESHLLTIYNRLDQAGMPAGSPVIRRLFSC